MAVWLGAEAPVAILAAAGLAVGAGLLLHRPGVVLIGALLAAGTFSGGLGEQRRQDTLGALVPDGPITVVGTALDDPRRSGSGTVFPLRPDTIVTRRGQQEWQGPRLAVSGGDGKVTAGDRVLVTGTVSAGPSVLRGDPVAGRIAARSITVVDSARDPLFLAGNLLRGRVHDGLESFAGRPEAGLLAGFLIGDVRSLPDADAEALRLAGLSHFVAVSGSNVALFLAAWWIAMGPLGWTPRRRAVLGLAGLAVFVVVTRWEPSVLRAATMAGLVLAGRVAAIPLGPWSALGGAVTVLLLTSPELSGNVGFQLSAAATAGVIAGAGAFAGRRPAWAWTALAATLSAQAAVAPLLLVHFGSVPLFAPITNVLAAPLVALSTSVGGVGVLLGAEPLTWLGLIPARMVLGIATGAADLPQLGPAGALLCAAAASAAAARRLRPGVTLVTAIVVAWTVVVPPSPPSGPLLEVLDVGQGDSILLRGPSGAVVLVDGGPDPRLLRRHLRDRGVGTIDLLIVTHGHADHTSGLVGITASTLVRRAWIAGQSEDEGALADLIAELAAVGVAVETPAVGWRATVGEFALDVLGPRRRYAGANDGSIVVQATAAGRTVLLAGDIEVIAQRELGPVATDVLKVPHQGAATSDLEWLAATAPSVAIISVGPNDFGHPAPEVIETLEAAGAVVLRTDRQGTVSIRLDRECDSRLLYCAER